MTEARPNKAFTLALVVAAACLIYAFSSGLRSNYGIMLGAISQNSAVSYASVSFILAVGQLLFGFMQPVFGVVALKKSNSFVLGCGALLMTAGLLMVPLCRSALTLMLFLGIVLPSGAGALSFGVIMGAIMPRLSEGGASTVSGLINASSGLGSTVLAPFIQTMTALAGIGGALLFLSIPALALLPLSLWLCKVRSDADSVAGLAAPNNVPLKALFAPALRSRTYRFLMIGFFTCGFHMAIIETHLFSQITGYGLSEKIAAYAFSIYGLASILGSVLSGVICARVEMRQVLGWLYGSRCVMTVIFLLAPKNIVTVYAFVALLGLTGNSTVVPTSGLVGRTFGAAKLATLFGLIFFVHQIGSFFSAWLGGICFAMTNSYSMIWCVAAAFSAGAAVASFSIKEHEISAMPGMEHGK